MISSSLLFKFEGNGFLFRYSTAAPTHFLDEAISASAKAGKRVYPSKNPDLTVNFLKNTGFNNTQIKILVSKYPALLFFNVEKTLKPKLHCLTQLGLSGSHLIKILLRDWTFFQRRLDTSIKPLINHLKNVLGSDENVVKVIKKCSWLISYNIGGTVEANLNLLRSFGCSSDKIKNLVLLQPHILKYNTKKLEEMLHRVQKEVGISPDSAMFLHIVDVLTSLSQETVDKKFGIFKSFGWSDSHILTMLQKLPYCVRLSEVRIQTSLTFLMKEARYNSVCIASFPALLMYSLEKRLIPRYEMWKLVNEKNLIKSRHKFSTVITWSESKFRKSYVLPVKAELPDVYDLYIKRIGK
ncbi:unnamed protein product [Withania somnifera]